MSELNLNLAPSERLTHSHQLRKEATVNMKTCSPHLVGTLLQNHHILQTFEAIRVNNKRLDLVAPDLGTNPCVPLPKKASHCPHYVRSQNPEPGLTVHILALGRLRQQHLKF